MAVSLEGYGNRYATLLGAAELEGLAVAITGENTVGQAADGAGIAGMATRCRDGAVLVQTHGCVTLPYTGDAPGYGCASLVGNGSGGVKAAPAPTSSDGGATITSPGGRAVLVTGVDTQSHQITAILL